MAKVKKRITGIFLMTMALLLLLALTTANSFACKYNSAKSKESFEIRYTAIIKFNPSHKTDAKCNYGIKKRKYIKKGYHKYSRNGKTIKTGTAGPAKKKTDRMYSNTMSCWDDIRIGDDYVTRYGYSWTYF